MQPAATPWFRDPIFDHLVQKWLGPPSLQESIKLSVASDTHPGPLATFLLSYLRQKIKLHKGHISLFFLLLIRFCHLCESPLALCESAAGGARAWIRAEQKEEKHIAQLAFTMNRG